MTKRNHLLHLSAAGLLAFAAGNLFAADGASEQELSAEELIERHCIRCHLAPEPKDLSKEYWPFALHYMGNYVGMPDDMFEDMTVEPVPKEWEPEKDYTRRYILKDDNGYMRDLYPFKPYIPSEPEMTVEQYRRIRAYYEENARSWRDMEIKRPKQPIAKGFEPTVPNLELAENQMVMATRVDEEKRVIYVGRAVLDDWVGGGGRREGFEDRDDIRAYDLETGRILHSVKLESDPIHLTLTDTGVRVLTHGRFPMYHEGLARLLDLDFTGEEPRIRMLVNGKFRFVEHQMADMNDDGLEDIVSVAFGDGIFGDANSELTVFWKTPQFEELWQDAPAEIDRDPGVLPGGLRETIISGAQGGMIGSDVGDLNGDGRPDIVALVAQGKQQLLVYTNNGDETFTRHLINQHTPSFGGNTVELGDFDGDGDLDISVINGDNVNGNHIANVVPAPRPQHSVRIYENHGNLNFTKAYHYPWHGGIRQVIEDFDGDGDLDIAAIALFPQWNEHEPETFVYLENVVNLNFAPQSFSSDYFSPWVSIEAADVNADDKPDIVLGLGDYPMLVPEKWKTELPVMKGRGGAVPSILYLINKH